MGECSQSFVINYRHEDYIFLNQLQPPSCFRTSEFASLYYTSLTETSQTKLNNLNQTGACHIQNMGLLII